MDHLLRPLSSRSETTLSLRPPLRAASSNGDHPPPCKTHLGISSNPSHSIDLPEALLPILRTSGYEAASTSSTTCSFDLLSSIASSPPLQSVSKPLLNSKPMLASPETASDADYAAILGVVGHEVLFCC
ncbi:hypothetical protein QJS10_CPB22g00844 [Acorus calamus]|uniref:Uncharacterized protein n=1 Tax=Acorus calamus TaxID=4465 RepID=A0AAV9C0R0_ACOCL|nr:hypothetical protein QJS10_CPB22g00844 [Acorus calamus]